MKPLTNGLCAAAGFRAGAAAAGVKKAGTTRLDCALIVSDRPCQVAGVFTTNRVFAAPVKYCREICAKGQARAFLVNSGNANACTGDQGYADTLAMAARAGTLLSIPAEEICVSSTGVIGVPMPLDRVMKGIEGCVAALSTEGSAQAAQAIMTTDTRPKELACEVALSSGTVRIGGIAKGSGMIAPSMATMLAFLTTDAAIDAPLLQKLLKEAADDSFNCICIDNDMSTNDSLMILANGASGTATLQEGSEDCQRFAGALKDLCASLARELVLDGEGATKFITITVEGAKDRASARQIAATIARSQLCKTAFYGCDANWGRIVCAAGYAGIPFDVDSTDLYIQGVHVFQNGRPLPDKDAEVQPLMAEPKLAVRLSLQEGTARGHYWTSDLSTEYVKINADYRT
ncbi:MAG: bifunctional glutamate N-acetyltransferase/amino-acid acetyltransferase ArgJ [Candidatus Hydrogenedens sp.]|nr:bifunctional glutamate N-acetyltransferase/amino-acid acetyltransferase ArgJ [Candidatus Hydrogenedens sp.]